MSIKNPEYDFKWCPGCGDFGVRRALEMAIVERNARLSTPMENTAIVAGIGCSGNLVHLLEGPQPYGFHGIHGRTLPIALGVKMGRPDLNVVIVAGDGDFLSIGQEHIAPQASRNLDVTAIIMDNAVYGLTKGQSSPTLGIGEISSSTPYGKIEEALNPLEFYLSIGVSFIASGYSSKPKDLARMMGEAMDHPGFSILHIQSPCTTYYDTYELLKGNKAKGIAPGAWEVPPEHDPTDRVAAHALIRSGGVPLGIIYRDAGRPALHDRYAELSLKAGSKNVADLMQSYRL